MTSDIDVIDAAIEGYWGTGTMDQLGDQAREIARASMRRALEAACAVSLGDAERATDAFAEPCSKCAKPLVRYGEWVFCDHCCRWPKGRAFIRLNALSEAESTLSTAVKEAFGND